MLLVTVRGGTFRIAVMKAGNISPTDVVKFEDNQGLYRLYRAFFLEKEVDFADLAQHGDDYEVTLHRRLPHPPEAYPSCIARALYLTSDGDVVQSEHTFTIVAAHAAR